MVLEGEKKNRVQNKCLEIMEVTRKGVADDIYMAARRLEYVPFKMTQAIIMPPLSEQQATYM